jgi:hypothetical protein
MPQSNRLPLTLGVECNFVRERTLSCEFTSTAFAMSFALWDICDAPTDKHSIHATPTRSSKGAVTASTTKRPKYLEVVQAKVLKGNFVLSTIASFARFEISSEFVMTEKQNRALRIGNLQIKPKNKFAELAAD